MRTRIWRATFSPMVRSWPSTDDDQRPVEGVLLADLHLDAGANPEAVEEHGDVGVGRPGQGHHGPVAGRRSYSGGMLGQVGALDAGDREPVGAGGGRSRAAKSRSSTSWGSWCSKVGARRSASDQL